MTGTEYLWASDTDAAPDAAPDEPRSWSARRLQIAVGGEPIRLRLVRFARGWVASADSVEGPTLGVNRSPYLAARQALEPLGIGLVATLSILGRLEN